MYLHFHILQVLLLHLEDTLMRYQTLDISRYSY